MQTKNILKQRSMIYNSMIGKCKNNMFNKTHFSNVKQYYKIQKSNNKQVNSLISHEYQDNLHKIRTQTKTVLRSNSIISITPDIAVTIIELNIQNFNNESRKMNDTIMNSLDNLKINEVFQQYVDLTQSGQDCYYNYEMNADKSVCLNITWSDSQKKFQVYVVNILHGRQDCF